MPRMPRCSDYGSFERIWLVGPHSARHEKFMKMPTNKKTSNVWKWGDEPPLAPYEPLIPNTLGERSDKHGPESVKYLEAASYEYSVNVR